tara:strand:- start:60 stop:509 length:450 start_codon:yes stop_codon:yes gene_type:complete
MFIQSIKRGFIYCFDFSSRSTRSELWYFILFIEILQSVAFILDNKIGFSIWTMEYQIENDVYTFYFGHLFLFTRFLTAIPLAALIIRRLHDTNRSGYWFLAFMIIYIINIFNDRFGLVVFFGIINLIIFFCTKSDHGKNKYGPESNLAN